LFKQQNKHSNVGIVGAAYCAMLLGWLAYESPTNTKLIQVSLPLECSFTSLADLLKLFMSFQLQAGILPEYPTNKQKKKKKKPKLFPHLTKQQPVCQNLY
jgi:hypothetical protein